MMFIIVLFLSISSSITSRTLIETTNLTTTNEQDFHFSQSYISTHRLIFAKLILLTLLACFFWICSCQLIVRQIYADKQRSKSSMMMQETISTIPIKQT
jgi:hypothetical protein